MVRNEVPLVQHVQGNFVTAYYSEIYQEGIDFDAKLFRDIGDDSSI